MPSEEHRQTDRVPAGGRPRSLWWNAVQDLPHATHSGDCCGRKIMDITRRRLLYLLPAAAIAWKYVEAGTPEEAPNYKTTDHWYGMLIDVTKCIGCGSCVRACQNENGVPDGYFRTWVERYHVAEWNDESPEVDSPEGGKNGFPPPKYRGGKNFF